MPAAWWPGTCIHHEQQLAGHAGASATYNCILCEARLHQTYVAIADGIEKSALIRRFSCCNDRRTLMKTRRS